MRLVPDQPVCPDHGVDLTSEVRAELQANPDHVPNAFARTQRASSGLRSYMVIVTCPQGGHDIDVSGTWEP